MSHCASGGCQRCNTESPTQAKTGDESGTGGAPSLDDEQEDHVPVVVRGRLIESPQCGRGDHLWFGHALDALGPTLFVQAPIGGPYKTSKEQPAICVADVVDGVTTWKSHIALPFDDMGRSRFFSTATTLVDGRRYLAVSHEGEEGCEGIDLHRRVGDDWSRVGHIEPPNGRSQTDFGRTLAFSGDLLIAGIMPGEEVPDARLRTYRLVGDELRERGAVLPPSGATTFGWQVASSPNGRWLAVVTTHAERVFAVDLYVRREDGFAHEQTLTAPGEIHTVALGDAHLAIGVVTYEHDSLDADVWTQTYRLDGRAWTAKRRFEPRPHSGSRTIGLALAIQGHRLAMSQLGSNTIVVANLELPDAPLCELAPTTDPSPRATVGADLAWVDMTLFASSRVGVFAFDTTGCSDP